MSRTKAQVLSATPVHFTPKELEMTIYGLKIWRQLIVAQSFVELRDGSPTPYQETLVEIDLALEKLDQAKGK